MRKWILAAATMLLHPFFAPHCGEPEPVVEVIAAEKEVAFGVPINVEARIRCPENEAVTVYPLNYLAKRKVTVKKEGVVKPFFWTGLARGDEETNVTIRDGALVYDLSGIFLFPGSYSISCEVGAGDKIYASAPLSIVVAKSEYDTLARVFSRFVLDSFDKTPDHEMDILLRQLHGVLMSLDGDASITVFAMLRLNRHDINRPAVYLKKEVVQVLGKLMDKELSAIRKRPRGTKKAGEIIQLMTEERSLFVVYDYLMIMHYLDDIMTKDDDRVLEAFIEKIKKLREKNVVFGAYMAGVGNSRYRAKYGSVLRDEVLGNEVMEDSAKGTVLSYLAMKKKEDGEE